MIPLPDVDRGRAEFPNVKAVVMEVNLSLVLIFYKKLINLRSTKMDSTNLVQYMEF
jgi:hypothetical protein